LTVTIYHNPACGTSRNTLAIIRAAGFQPTVVEYLATPLSRAELTGLLASTGRPVRELLRRKDTPFEALGLDDPALDDAALVDHVVRHPILMNRPIVATPLGVDLCRPSEAVARLLPSESLPETFTKEDGETVRFAEYSR